MEMFSIMSTGTTIYCGLLYIVYDFDFEWEMTIFIVILIANFVFVAYWVKEVFLAIYTSIVKKKKGNNLCAESSGKSGIRETDRSAYGLVDDLSSV
jgi:membrane protein implicated in regulation of membrane protease activity